MGGKDGCCGGQKDNDGGKKSCGCPEKTGVGSCDGSKSKKGAQQGGCAGPGGCAKK